MSSIYLDWAASGLPMDEVLSECTQVAKAYFANPSSVHAPGKAAHHRLETARAGCASIIGCRPQELFFTSGGSEANNIIFASLLHKKRKGSVVISAVEHASVYEPAIHLKEFGFEVRLVKPRSNGVLDPIDVKACIDQSTQCVSVIHVNNETGSIQPVSAIAKAVRDVETSTGKKILFHCDAVQSFGKLPVNVIELDVDALSASGHKLGGPKGSGLLFLNREMQVLYRGGGQESGIRPGTENLPAVWGLYRSASIWDKTQNDVKNQAQKLAAILKGGIDLIENGRLVPATRDAELSTHSPFIVAATFPPIPGEVLVRAMTDRGFFISTGSACSSRGAKKNRVLGNIGISKDVADSAIRISIGPTTKEGDCRSFCDALRREVSTLRNAILGSGSAISH